MANKTFFSPVAENSLELSGIDDTWSPDDSGMVKALLGNPPKSATKVAAPVLRVANTEGGGSDAPDLRPEDSVSQAAYADSTFSTGVIEAQILLAEAEAEALTAQHEVELKANKLRQAQLKAEAEAEELNAQREAGLKANKLRQAQLKVQLAEARFNQNRSRSSRSAPSVGDLGPSRALSDIVGGGGASPTYAGPASAQKPSARPGSTRQRDLRVHARADQFRTELRQKKDSGMVAMAKLYLTHTTGLEPSELGGARDSPVPMNYVLSAQ